MRDTTTVVPKCQLCGDTKMVPVSCPDDPQWVGGMRVSCAVLHMGPCPNCNARPPREPDEGED